MGLSAETSAQDPDNSVCNGYSLNKTEGYWKIMSDAGSLRCCFFTAEEYQAQNRVHWKNTRGERKGQTYQQKYSRGKE